MQSSWHFSQVFISFVNLEDGMFQRKRDHPEHARIQSNRPRWGPYKSLCIGGGTRRSFLRQFDKFLSRKKIKTRKK